MFSINPHGAERGHRVLEFSKCLEILSLCLFLDEPWKTGSWGLLGARPPSQGQDGEEGKGLLFPGVSGVPVIHSGPLSEQAPQAGHGRHGWGRIPGTIFQRILQDRGDDRQVRTHRTGFY